MNMFPSLLGMVILANPVLHQASWAAAVGNLESDISSFAFLKGISPPHAINHRLPICQSICDRGRWIGATLLRAAGTAGFDEGSGHTSGNITRAEVRPLARVNLMRSFLESIENSDSDLVGRERGWISADASDVSDLTQDDLFSLRLFPTRPDSTDLFPKPTQHPLPGSTNAAGTPAPLGENVPTPPTRSASGRSPVSPDRIAPTAASRNNPMIHTPPQRAKENMNMQKRNVTPLPPDQTRQIIQEQEWVYQQILATDSPEKLSEKKYATARGALSPQDNQDASAHGVKLKRTSITKSVDPSSGHRNIVNEATHDNRFKQQAIYDTDLSSEIGEQELRELVASLPPDSPIGRAVQMLLPAALFEYSEEACMQRRELETTQKKTIRKGSRGQGWVEDRFA